jgi:alkylhydroperoxidase family enzyme
MPRLAPLEPPHPADLAAELAAMMPPGAEPLKLFRTLAHNPRVLSRIRGGNLLDRGSLERPERELAILRTTARCRSEYEWGVHVAFFARRLGLGQETIAGSCLWSGDDPRWTARQGAIVRLVDALHESARLDDALWRELSAHFAPDQIVELLVLVGFYHTISFVTNGLEIELEDFGERFPQGEPAWAGARRAPPPAGRHSSKRPME